jgi:hypothetical protein
MSVEAKCKACGGDDLQIELKGGEADDDSAVIYKNCGNKWTFADHKQQIAESAEEEIKKMLEKFKL